MAARTGGVRCDSRHMERWQLMNPFQALLHSLLEHSVEYIRQDVDLHALRVSGDERTESAHVEIVLNKDTWDEQQRAIDHMIEVRSMFIEEISLDYVFVRLDDWQSADAKNFGSQQFVFAA